MSQQMTRPALVAQSMYPDEIGDIQSTSGSGVETTRYQVSDGVFPPER